MPADHRERCIAARRCDDAGEGDTEQAFADDQPVAARTPIRLANSGLPVRSAQPSYIQPITAPTGTSTVSAIGK